MNKKKALSLTGKILSGVGIVGISVALGIGNYEAYFWQMQLDRILCPPIIDSDSVQSGSAQGQTVAKEIIKQGSVLLENKDHVLPLSKDTDRKVNVFGYNSVDWMHGSASSGSSGRVMRENANSEVIDFLRAMTRYGISYNTKIQDAYTNWAEPLKIVDNLNVSQLGIKEAPMSIFSQELLSEAEAYSQTALVVISRSTAEGVDAAATQKKTGPGTVGDSTRHFLQISTEEEELLTYVGSHYQKVIVLLNCPMPLECTFMKTIPGLDALVHVGQTGTQAVSALPALLYGDESFSGRTADTYATDINQFSPVGASDNSWFAGSNLNNHSSYKNEGVNSVEYIEGIYVGYKWYETADKEGVWANVDNEFGKGYDGVVQYPFGYGLSYATFDWTLKKAEPAIGSAITALDKDTKISLDVEVTNTSGTYSGRDVVEVYVTVPYYEGEIEKPYVALVGFAKTSLLGPGQSETVTVTIKGEDLLSYDCYDSNNNGFKGYELDHSTTDHPYQIKLMENSHTIKKMDFDLGDDRRNDVDGILDYSVPETLTFPNDLYTGQPVHNLFTGDAAIDGSSLDCSDGDVKIPWMKRSEFTANANYSIPERTDEIRHRTLNDKQFSHYDYSVEKANAWDSATTDSFGEAVDQTTKVTWSASTDYKVADGVTGGTITDLGYKLGKDYDDPDWDKVLDQVPVSEAAEMLGPCISGNKALPSIGKPALSSLDSINQIGGFTSGDKGTGNPNAVMLAQTFSPELMHQFGLAFGQDMNSLNIQSVYGPGANLHRSPRGGRNFEYYSEDTYLTGIACINVVQGIQERGCSVELKHFIANEVEFNRARLCTYMTEQTLRETYLRPFQRAVEEAGCSGLMTAYSNIGGAWCGGSEALLTGVLRKEWGFHGLVDTDWTGVTGFVYGEIAEQLRAGGDLGMGFGLNATDKSIHYDETATPRLQRQMREAVHHVLYSWLSSREKEKEYVETSGETSVHGFSIESWKWWRVVLPILDAFVIGDLLIWAIAVYVPSKKNPQGPKKEEENADSGKGGAQ